MIKAALVALIVMAIGWTGLNIPESAVQETVDSQLDSILDQVTQTQPDAAMEINDTLSVAAQVTDVIDGDTARVLIDGQEVTLRFIGIDTPETEFSPAGAECYGGEATVRARNLLSDQTVILTSDPTQATRDVHDRLLVYAELPDERDFGEIMLQEGFAYEYTYAADYANQGAYQAAEASAKENDQGLWSACN